MIMNSNGVITDSTTTTAAQNESDSYNNYSKSSELKLYFASIQSGEKMTNVFDFFVTIKQSL